MASGSGDAAQRLITAAHESFIHGLRLASWVAFVVALLGAAVAWRLLPGGVAISGATPAVDVPTHDGGVHDDDSEVAA